MTTTATAREAPPGDRPDLGGRRRWADKAFRTVALLAGLSVLAILILIAY
jgi:hypothetical protein